MRLNRAVLLFILLCAAYPMALNAGQLKDGIAAMDNGDYTSAHKLLYPLAEAGDAEAQNALGAMYVNGQGVEKDLQKGLAYIVKAAQQGHAIAQQAECLLLLSGGPGWQHPCVS